MKRAANAARSIRDRNGLSHSFFNSSRQRRRSSSEFSSRRAMFSRDELISTLREILAQLRGILLGADSTAA